jgi:hypothetical protein
MLNCVNLLVFAGQHNLCATGNAVAQQTGHVTRTNLARFVDNQTGLVV